MIIDCISDLHGFFPKLEGGDLLIIAGDLTANDSIQQLEKFYDWLALQQYKKKIYIAGNHDNLLFEKKYHTPQFCDAEYLCDSTTKFDGLNIWGTPWSMHFKQINPKCKAFVTSENKLEEKYKKIPKDTDIIISHGPPYGILDGVKRNNGEIEYTGSPSLLSAMFRIKPKLMVFGHIHEGYGQIDLVMSKCVNASIVNEKYQSINKPIRIIL